MIKNPRTLFRITMSSIVLSETALWLSRRFVGMPVNLLDGAGGLFLGIAIGTLWLGGRHGGFRRPGAGAPPCG